MRITPEHGFVEVRRAALAIAREIERRAGGLATSKWWKKERQGVFLDYNQNARDRTVASAYSVRPVADARVSCPLGWDEVPDVEPAELRLDTVPQRVAERGDPSADIDAHAGSIASLLELARADEESGPAGRALAAALPQIRVGTEPGAPARLSARRFTPRLRSGVLTAVTFRS